MTERQNAKYSSNTTQSEVLQSLAGMVRTQIISEVNDSEQFSIMADESKYIKKTEQLSLVRRYYENGAICESFLHILEAERLDAEG